MPFNLVNANAVIVAHHFNPTITDQIWLAENGIVNRDELLGSYIFTDMLVQVQSRDFHLLIVPERCQLTPSDEVEEQQEIVAGRLGRLIDVLPHTPYRAVGLNFGWNYLTQNVPDFVRRRFFVENCPLYRDFNAMDARFGGYLSKDWNGFRLKLDIKPVIVQTDDDQTEAVHFGFNFNLDVSGNGAVERIGVALAKWNESKALSQQLVERAVEGFE